MNKLYIWVPSLLILGIATGILLTRERDDQDPRPPAEPSRPSAAAVSAADGHPMADAFAIVSMSDSERIEALERQVLALQSRIEQLERSTEDPAEPDEAKTVAAMALPGQSTVDTPVSNQNPAVTTANLVMAGIDAEIAADIVRRRNEMDMKLLQLRDRATREGYYGTERYLDEVNALRDQSPSLRAEIGDDYYDSYLFRTRQTNRVKVASVMMGSPAEMSGMQDGDLILSYDNRKIFNWSELQEATTRGERGEYVNVSVLRNGQLHNLWLPRGPLGIRLGAARVRP